MYTYPVKIRPGDLLVYVKWCRPARQAFVETQWQSNATVKFWPFHDLAMIRHITISMVSISGEYPRRSTCWKSFLPSNCFPCCVWVGIVLLKNEIWSLTTQIPPVDADRCFGRILTYYWKPVFLWTSTRCPACSNPMQHRTHGMCCSGYARDKTSDGVLLSFLTPNNYSLMTLAELHA